MNKVVGSFDEDFEESGDAVTLAWIDIPFRNLLPFAFRATFAFAIAGIVILLPLYLIFWIILVSIF